MSRYYECANCPNLPNCTNSTTHEYCSKFWVVHSTTGGVEMTKDEAEKKYDHICYHCHHFFIALDDSQKCDIGFKEKDPTDSCKRFELDYRLYDRNGYLEQKRKVKRTTHSVANKYWHKIEEEGLPVVEGWYLCLSQGRMLISYDCAFFNGSKFEWSDTDLSQFVIAWHKIEEYK